MSIDRIFVVFMIVVGATVGVVVVIAPQVREFRVPPYFWVLLAMAGFEVANFLRAKGIKGEGNAEGTMVGMDARLAGFVLGIVVMVVVPVLLGGSVPKLF